MIGVAQHYAWGDADYVPRLLGTDPDGRPWAEWWLGTHPGGPATLADGRALADASGELPYLLKLLAADVPLSLQTHPTREQAEEGFDREERAGIPRHAPERIYRDRSPKPELLCALTPFDALCGFRPVGASIELCDELGVRTLAAALREHGLPATVRALFRGELAAAPIVEACRARPEAEARLVDDLARRHPGDPAGAISLLLNRVVLRPGEALFLGPGNLHAYVQGAGVEVMGASDNVVRGGLTDKHVDVEELLRVVDIVPLHDPVVVAEEVEPDRWCYDAPGTPFRLWRLEVAGEMVHVATGRELLLCTDGATDVLDRGATVLLQPGERLVVHGIATVFRVEERQAS